MLVDCPDSSWKDYELIDCGNYEKLERFGRIVMVRPEPKALWDKTLSDEEWLRRSHTKFAPGAGFAKAGKEDSGTWQRLKRMDDQWYISYGGSGKSGVANVAEDGARNYADAVDSVNVLAGGDDVIPFRMRPGTPSSLPFGFSPPR